jgi:hypothetical protein
LALSQAMTPVATASAMVSADPITAIFLMINLLSGFRFDRTNK